MWWLARHKPAKSRRESSIQGPDELVDIVSSQRTNVDSVLSRLLWTWSQFVSLWRNVLKGECHCIKYLCTWLRPSLQSTDGLHKLPYGLQWGSSDFLRFLGSFITAGGQFWWKMVWNKAIYSVLHLLFCGVCLYLSELWYWSLRLLQNIR